MTEEDFKVIKWKKWYCKVHFESGDDGGGLVLRNVYHQYWKFAKEIRIVRIFVRLKNSVIRNYSLGSPNAFEIKGEKIHVKSTPEELPHTDPRGFYKPILGIRTDYLTKDTLYPETSQKLQLSQEYLFTDYSNEPSHEGSGALPAARIYPVLIFHYPERKSLEDEHLPVQIRVDYMIHCSIDSSVNDKDLPNLQKEKLRERNQAGTFKDQETAGFGALGRSLTGYTTVFKNAEKPLKFEIVGEGLSLGIKDNNKSEKGPWDNIHQWGVQPDVPHAYGKNKTYAPTPGAPLAAHTHWRWGEFSARKTIMGEGGKHFAGPSGEAGAALVDPLVPNQSLRFAVTNSRRLFDVRKKISSQIIDKSTHSLQDFIYNFDESFTTQGAPEMIDDGADLVTWFSIAASREKSDIDMTKKWDGSLFAHGYFFPHEPESILPSFLMSLNPKSPIYLPHENYGPPNSWVRPKGK